MTEEKSRAPWDIDETAEHGARGSKAVSLLLIPFDSKSAPIRLVL